MVIDEDNKTNKTEEHETTYSWYITESSDELDQGKIPDDTIIVCYDPEYVDKLEGGTNIDLPRIIIKDNILELVGSEDKLHELSTTLLLSSLDSDSMHSKIEHEVKQNNQTMLVAFKTM